MIIEVKIPSPGESVTEVSVGSWLVDDNEYVEKDQEIAEVETDKATLPLIAPEAGIIKLQVQQGQHIQVGDVACTIDTSTKPKSAAKRPETAYKSDTGIKDKTFDKPQRTLVRKESHVQPEQSAIRYTNTRITPLARKLIEEHNLNVNNVFMGLQKITKRDVELAINDISASGEKVAASDTEHRKAESTPISPLRRKLGKRLVDVKNETAMLTTFNEVDMSIILSLRKKYQQAFQEKHSIKLGLVSFFVKACAVTLMDLPQVNSMIENDNLITFNYVDISIAVQTDKGLMVPVIRNAHMLNIVEIEKSIGELANKARNSRLSIEEMTGGTFTITNGGVFGSMLSTPIINPPQAAILGMHNIVERPVVINGEIEARPIMYIALSYDHRLVDGKDSVSFLVKVKEHIENPVLMAKSNHEKALLSLI